MHRVLLADDEPWAAYALKHLVNWEKQGFLVIDTVFNGMEALSKCEALQPQVLITDIRMPEMDGLELLTAVRVKVKGIKVILVSGYSDFDYARQAIRHGAFDYLVKPIASAELTDLLVRIKSELGVVPQERPPITVDEQSSTPIKKALDYAETAGGIIRRLGLVSLNTSNWQKI
jgi:two-component system response regulator YesN